RGERIVAKGQATTRENLVAHHLVTFGLHTWMQSWVRPYPDNAPCGFMKRRRVSEAEEVAVYFLRGWLLQVIVMAEYRGIDRNAHPSLPAPRSGKVNRRTGPANAPDPSPYSRRNSREPRSVLRHY